VKQKPDADGLYWFRGTFGGDPYATIVEVYDKDCISILGDDCPCMVQDFDGEWHGPLVAPWDASATGVFITLKLPVGELEKELAELREKVAEAEVHYENCPYCWGTE